jgi:FkbM family methyltransferase
MSAKAVYLQLIKVGFCRRPLRRVRAAMQRLVGYSDPYFDLAKIARTSRTKVLFDIGCHHGETTKRLIESGIQCPVVAIDPLAENLAVARNELQRWPQVSFVECAVAEERGRAAFFVNANEQTSSLLDNEHGNEQSFKTDTAHVRVVEIPTITLNSLLQQNHGGKGLNAIVKVDAQGAEGSIIRGGMQSIRDEVAAFYCEIMLGKMYKGQFSFDQIRKLLEDDCGMVLANLYPCLHDSEGRAVQMDALWVKPQFAKLPNLASR